MDAITIDLPLPRDECHQNARAKQWALSKAAGADHTDGVNATRKVLQDAKAEPPRWDAAIISLHFRFPNRRGRDLLNYAAATKYQLDGIVEAGIVTDDKCTVIERIGGISWSVDKQNTGVAITVTPIKQRKAA